MSVKHGLLALLEREPMYGYQLRTEFESSTGSAWPLNVGQVYTTLTRLEKSGLVQQVGEPDAEGRRTYAITDEGRADLLAWFTGAVLWEGRPRDELAIKLAMAVTTPGVDVREVVQIQRAATLRSLQTLTRSKRALDPADPADTASLLVAESMIFSAEAEVRWLDHCEAVLVQRLSEARPRSGAVRLGQGDAPSDQQGAHR